MLASWWMLGGLETITDFHKVTGKGPSTQKVIDKC